MNRQVQAIIFNMSRKVDLQIFELPQYEPEEIITETIYSFVSPETKLINKSAESAKS